MPNITGYDNPIAGLQPTDRGSSAWAAAGRRAGAFFNQAAGDLERLGQETARTVTEGAKLYEDYKTHQEVAHGAVGYAGLLNDLTSKWDATAKQADPNDPTVAAKFSDQVLEPSLENYRKGFTTERSQDWAERRIESLRNHMQQRSIADMATKAGDAAAVNMKRVINTMTNIASRDPSSVDMLLKEGEATIAGIVDSSPNLKGVNASHAKTKLTETMQEQIVLAGAYGAIQRSSDPEKTAQEWGEKYPQYIDGAKLKMLGHAANSELRAQRTEERMMKAEQDRQSRQISLDAREEWESKLDSTDPAERMNASQLREQVWRDGRLSLKDKEGVRRFIEKKLKPERDTVLSARNSAGLFNDLRNVQTREDADDWLERVKTAYGTPAGENGSITKADYAFLQNEYDRVVAPGGLRNNRMLSTFFERMAPAINMSVAGIKDSPAMYEYQSWVSAQVKAHPNDWMKLINPQSPEYLGRPEVLRQFQKPITQLATEHAARLAGAPVIPQPPRPKQPSPTSVWSENASVNGKKGQWIEWDPTSGRWIGVGVE